MKALATALLLLAAPPALAAPAAEERVTVAMTDHGFVPHRIDLQHGRRYVLRFVNRSSRGHDFEAPAFFHRIRIAPASAGVIRNNKVNLDPGQSAVLHFVAPAGPGRFPYKSTHVSDALSGMSGYIVMR